MANGRFAKMAKRFVLVVDDSRDGGSDVAKKYSLSGSRSYFLVLDSKGEELGRFGTHKKFEFDDEVIRVIESIEASFRRSQTDVFDYLLTWIDDEDVDPSRFNELVSNLDSPQFADRESSSKTLLSIGEPAFQFLSNQETTVAEAQSRIFSIVKQLRRHRDVIVRNGLDHDVSYLAQHAGQHPVVARYLRNIMPAEVDEDIQAWWTKNGDRFQWDVHARKFVLPEIISSKD